MKMPFFGSRKYDASAIEQKLTEELFAPKFEADFVAAFSARDKEEIVRAIHAKQIFQAWCAW